MHPYDAFNHLLSIHSLGTASISATTGQIVSGTLGDLVARYAYDGLGRLIAKFTTDGGSDSLGRESHCRPRFALPASIRRSRRRGRIG
jgi:YD repeat-containing protein